MRNVISQKKSRVQKIKFQSLHNTSPICFTYLYANCIVCFRDPISWTIAKNFSSPFFSCFSNTSIKWWPKQLCGRNIKCSFVPLFIKNLCPKNRTCIITQSTAPGRLMSVARNTISSPCRVVMDLWFTKRWGITCSKDPTTKNAIN